MQNHGNWITITESSFSWERDALNFVRERFPSTEPFLAWSNFEFIASDGSINEVDLLVFTPQGFFLIEIKSRPGRISGDAGTWKWEADSTFAVDNPLLLINQKAKKLSSLLRQTKTFRKDGRVPFLEALVFCSAEQIQSDLAGTAAYRICFRDNSDGNGKRPGIMDAILKRRCPGLDSAAKGTFDRPTVRLITKAMGEAGIRPSQKSRRVSDYVLEQLMKGRSTRTGERNTAKWSRWFAAFAFTTSRRVLLQSSERRWSEPLGVRPKSLMNFVIQEYCGLRGSHSMSWDQH
jgi:hypothetical protein